MSSFLGLNDAAELDEIGTLDAGVGSCGVTDAGVNTMTVPSTVVLKFKKPRTVTVGSVASESMSSAAVRGSARGALGTYTGAAAFASTCRAAK